jgi:hypothetical protein
VGLDRDQSRARVALEDLAPAAVERIARSSFGRLPITLVDRARALLHRYFSDGPWSVEDDASLSALVGPGEGWTSEELAPGIVLSFGWRGGTFRVDVAAELPAAPEGDTPQDESAGPIPQHDRTLGETFEDAIVIEVGRNPAELRFVTGPGTRGPIGRYTRSEQGPSAAVAALFRDFEEIEQVRVDRGVVSVMAQDALRWNSILLQVFDVVVEAFAAPLAKPVDRQYERAIKEIGALNAGNPRDLARLLDATTSPDPAFRRLAVAKLETADPLVVQKPWGRSLEDSSRAVRRAAIRAMAYAARTELRPLYERALSDKDACIRYYALRGIAQIGVGRADQSVERRKRDDDIRVRIAANAALDGRIPQ